MKVATFDTKTGNPTGDWEIPDDIVHAAFAVYDWMLASGTTQLAGLTLSEFPEGLYRGRRVALKQEPQSG